MTGHLAEQVEALAGDGRAFGLEIAASASRAPDGSADAVRGRSPPAPSPRCSSCAADTVFAAGDVGRFARRRPRARPARSPSPRPAAGPGAHGRRPWTAVVVAVLDRDGAGPSTAAPLWAVGAAVRERLCLLPGSALRARRTPSSARSTPGTTVRAVAIGKTRDLTVRLTWWRRTFRTSAGMTMSDDLRPVPAGPRAPARGMAAQATVALEKAKRREPDKASIREALGIAYFRIQRWREAERSSARCSTSRPRTTTRTTRSAARSRSRAAPRGERPLQARALVETGQQGVRGADPRPGRPRGAGELARPWGGDRPATRSQRQGSGSCTWVPPSQRSIPTAATRSSRPARTAGRAR